MVPTTNLPARSILLEERHPTGQPYLKTSRTSRSSRYVCTCPETNQFSLITPHRACGQVIALGLDILFAKKILKLKNTHFQKSILTQEGFSSNLKVSSTTLQLGKSSWPLQILLVCRLGKGSATPETQTLLAPNHTPYHSRDIRLNTPTLLLSLQLALGP